MAGGRVMAVLVFFMAEPRESDQRLADFVATVVGQLGIFIEQKIMEQALRNSHERLQAVMDNSPNVIYIKDLNGKFIHINNRFENLFHVSRVQIVGATDYDFFPKEVADALRAHDAQVLRQRGTLEYEEVVPQDDGPHTYLSCKFPLCDDTGAPYGVCGISADISERKRHEDLLENEVKKRTADLLETNKALRLVNAEKEQAILELVRKKNFPPACLTRLG